MGEHAPKTTPGPWTVRVDGWQPWDGAIAILGPDRQVIAYTTTLMNEKADAPLLAAAPTLVKALEEILSAEKQFREGMPDAWEGDPLTDACRAAREALAKVSQS